MAVSDWLLALVVLLRRLVDEREEAPPVRAARPRPRRGRPRAKTIRDAEW